MPLYLLIPFFSAVIYAFSAIIFRRGYDEGAGTIETFHWANLIGMPVFLPLFFFQPQELPLAEVWRPALCAALIYAASWSTFAAMKSGDVSLVTPVLGTKVIFVALFTVLITGVPLTPILWLACFLASVGVYFTGLGNAESGLARSVTLALCAASSVGFGLTDVMIQLWAKPYGGTRFLAAIPQFIGLYSLLLIPFTAPSTFKLNPSARPWVLAGSILLCVQGMAMGIAIGFFDDATGVNVVYSTRGLWSILIVIWLGSFFGNYESKEIARRTMVFRLVGSILIICGVFLAIHGAAHR